MKEGTNHTHMLKLYGLIATTPRVGQNAVLGPIRTVIPGADQYGDARPFNNILILTAGYPTPAPNAHDTRYVRISRQDKVAQAISWVLADATGRFLSTQTSNATEPRYDRDRIQTCLDNIAAGETVWNRYLINQKVLDLNYETDIAADPADAAQKILRWFGLSRPHRPVAPGPTDIRRFDIDRKERWRQLWDTGTGRLCVPRDASLPT